MSAISEATPHNLPERLQKTAVFLGIATVIAGILVLIGWVFDIAFFENIAVGFVPMNPMTAVAFILCGLAVALSAHNGARIRIGSFFGSAAALIGVLKILSYYGLGFPIDTLLFHEKLLLFQPPSEMAFSAALCFLLVGLAVLNLDREVCSRRPAQYFAAAVGAFGFLMATAYLYGTNFGGVTPILHPMALHTSILFLMLAAALLFLRPEAGVMATVSAPTIGGKVTRSMLLLLLILPFVIMWFVLKGLNDGYYDDKFAAAFGVTLNVVVYEIIYLYLGVAINNLESERDKTRQSEDVLIESMGEGFISVDAAANIIRINRRAEEILGLVRKDCKGKNYYETVPLQDENGNAVPPEKRPLWNILSVGKADITPIYQYTKSDGTKIQVEVVVSLMVRNGETAGAIILFRDITRMIKGRRQLLERTAELERLNRFMVDRELRMAELKKEIKELDDELRSSPANLNPESPGRA